MKMEKIKIEKEPKQKSSKFDSKYTKIYQNDELMNLAPVDFSDDIADKDFKFQMIEDFDQITPITIEKTQNFLYKKIGNTFTFFGDKNGNPRIIIGPHWPMYLCFMSIMTFFFMCYFYFFWIHFHVLIKYTGIIVYLFFYLSYTICFLINPGYPKHDLDSETGMPREKFKFCERCKMWVNVEKKPVHCFDCDICVEGYDHHCPWTSKCIGKRNMFAFYCFLTSVIVAFVYFAISIVDTEIRMVKSKKAGINQSNKNKGLL